MVTTPVGTVAAVVAESATGVVVHGGEAADLAAALGQVVRQDAGALRARCAALGTTFSAERVLGQLYADNRQLAQRISSP